MNIGKYTYDVNNIIVLYPEFGTLTIGSFCSIASNCTIYLGGNHRSDWITTYPFGHIHQNIFNKFNGDGHPSTNGNVVIGSDVWVGNNVTIMSGVTIGHGSVLAANSHIVCNVEPYSIFGGNPARFIKYRFDESMINKLLLLEWWNLSDEKINEISPLLCSKKYQEALKCIESI